MNDYNPHITTPFERLSALACEGMANPEAEVAALKACAVALQDVWDNVASDSPAMWEKALAGLSALAKARQP